MALRHVGIRPTTTCKRASTAWMALSAEARCLTRPQHEVEGRQVQLTHGKVALTMFLLHDHATALPDETVACRSIADNQTAQVTCTTAFLRPVHLCNLCARLRWTTGMELLLVTPWRVRLSEGGRLVLGQVNEKQSSTWGRLLVDLLREAWGLALELAVLRGMMMSGTGSHLLVPPRRPRPFVSHHRCSGLPLTIGLPMTMTSRMMLPSPWGAPALHEILSASVLATHGLEVVRA